MKEFESSEYLRQRAGDRVLFEQAARSALQYMAGVNERPVYPTDAALEGLKVFQEKLPDGPADPSAIIEMLHRAGSPATVAQTGGRYFGFVNGGALPAAVAARWLSDAWDQNAALHVISPVASVLESVCEEWLVDLLGLPAGTAAGLVGGTSIATLCGLAAGRDELLRRAGWDAREKGLFGAPEIRVVCGGQAHASVLKALSLLGLGRGRITAVPVDDQGRIDPKQIETDARTLLILQAGNVNTGAFDPFAEICRKAKESGAWIHVDGAFGLWAAASHRHRHLTKGVEMADSWSADAHKTLNAPYDNGIIFCRDRDALARAMHMSGSYILYGEKRDGLRYAPDMSRRARSVDLWAALKSLGRSGTAALVDELCDKALWISEELGREGFRILNEVCFNQVLAACETPELTRATLSGIQRSGECWCGGAEWNGEPVIRISVCSFMTTGEDLARTVRAFKAARAEARTAGKR